MMQVDGQTLIEFSEAVAIATERNRILAEVKDIPLVEIEGMRLLVYEEVIAAIKGENNGK